MRAVLVPPLLLADENDEAFPVHPPLGIMRIASTAIQNGHDVVICDLNVARCRGDLVFHKNWYEEAAEYVLAFHPQLVGFGTLCSSFPATILICKELKKHKPSIPTVFGGPQATMVYEPLLQNFPEIDFILTGEADFSFTQFLEEFGTNGNLIVPGLARREGRSIKLDPAGSPVDLESLETIDYDIWPVKEVTDNGWYQSGIPIDAGRGCPYQCSFCSTNKFFRRKYRMKSPSRIKEEITQLYNKFGFTSFKLVHDSFTSSRKHAEGVTKELAECQVPGLRWSCSARCDTVDSELLAAMRKGGCTGLFFGIETASTRMQKKINKFLNLDAIEPMLSQALKLGFDFTVSFIVGFPDEEWSDIEASIEVLLRWSGIEKVRTQLRLLAPQTGTAILEKYGGRLQFDSWFPDRAFFNSRCPEPELEFVKRHPELCPQCFFIPNDRVNRKELAEINEFVFLLRYSLPGLGPFLQRLEVSPLELIRRWQVSCDRKGLPPPNETGFFSYHKNNDKVPYARALFEELRKIPVLSDMQLAFLSFWDALLDIVCKPHAHKKSSSSGSEIFLEEIDQDKEVIPVITQRCFVKVFEYEVNSCLQDWIHKGVWNWPVKRTVYYLFGSQDDQIQVCEISRITALIFQKCDGRFTLTQLFSYVNDLTDPETDKLKRTMGTAVLIGEVLGALREIVGLTFIVKNPENDNPEQFADHQEKE